MRTQIVLARLAVPLMWILMGTALRAADGPTLYKVHCAPCHGADGKGQTPMGKKVGAKDLAVSAAKDEDIARQIREGARDKKGTLIMPSFKDRLADEDVKAVVETAKKFRKPASEKGK